MLEYFAYPVSGIMKMWHIALSSLGAGPSTAWVFSIVGLVITVRLLLIPLFWIQKRSNHRGVLMRPELEQLRERYANSTDPEDVRALVDGEAELKKKYDYKAAAGCLPIFIQIPVILGLYRLLLWMSLPEALKTHANSSGGIGMLSQEDVNEFLNARLFEVPLPAYRSMTDEQFTALDTTASVVHRALDPMLIIACLLTATSLALSYYYSRRNLNWASASARGMLRIVLGVSLCAPLLLLTAGLTGPIPIALIFYWVLSSTWSLLQTIALNIAVERDMPETDFHREHRQKTRENFRSQRREKKEKKIASRRFVTEARNRGLSRSEARKELKEQRRRESEEEAAKKKANIQRRREINKMRSEIQSKRMRERIEKMQARRNGSS